MSGTPRFGPACRFFPAGEIRNIRQFLKGVCHFHIMGATYFFDPAANHFTEILFNIMTDNKNNFIKPGLDGVVNRIINNDVAAVIYRLQLFNTATKTGTNARS